MKLHAYMLILPFFLKVQLKVPVVVRLEGTNVEQGKRILKVNSEFHPLGRNLFTALGSC